MYLYYWVIGKTKTVIAIKKLLNGILMTLDGLALNVLEFFCYYVNSTRAQSIVMLIERNFTCLKLNCVTYLGRRLLLDSQQKSGLCSDCRKSVELQ